MNTYKNQNDILLLSYLERFGIIDFRGHCRTSQWSMHCWVSPDASRSRWFLWCQKVRLKIWVRLRKCDSNIHVHLIDAQQQRKYWLRLERLTATVAAECLSVVAILSEDQSLTRLPVDWPMVARRPDCIWMWRKAMEVPNRLLVHSTWMIAMNFALEMQHAY